MKYIMIETGDGARYPIIFPEAFVHADMAKLVNAITRVTMNSAAMPVSAGFVMIGEAHVHGKSETLNNLEHKPSDAHRIMFGDAVAFLPDAMLSDLAKKMPR